jgi:hypothetical protein
MLTREKQRTRTNSPKDVRNFVSTPHFKDLIQELIQFKRYSVNFAQILRFFCGTYIRLLRIHRMGLYLLFYERLLPKPQAWLG